MTYLERVGEVMRATLGEPHGLKAMVNTKFVDSQIWRQALFSPLFGKLGFLSAPLPAPREKRGTGVAGGDVGVSHPIGAQLEERFTEFALGWPRLGRKEHIRALV